MACSFRRKPDHKANERPVSYGGSVEGAAGLEAGSTRRPAARQARSVNVALAARRAGIAVTLAYPYAPEFGRAAGPRPGPAARRRGRPPRLRVRQLRSHPGGPLGDRPQAQPLPARDGGRLRRRPHPQHLGRFECRGGARGAARRPADGADAARGADPVRHGAGPQRRAADRQVDAAAAGISAGSTASSCRPSSSA